MPSKTEIENAYAAGLFDGEGHIAIAFRSGRGSGKNKYPRYMLQLSMSQNNRPAVDWLAAKYGGTSRFTTGKRSYNNTRYERWNWVIATASAAEFLIAIRPYAIVKKYEIEIALAFQASMMITGRAKLPDNVIAFRKKCFEDIRRVRGTADIRPPYAVDK